MPPSSAPSNLDLVLHIGSGKTGTSSIQHFLGANRDALTEHGWLYPKTPGQGRHVKLGLFVKPDDMLEDTPSWRRQRFASPPAFRKAFRRQLFREIEQSGLTQVLMSDEALYASPDQALRRMRRFTNRVAASLKLVVYLRRQDDHLVSRYQQMIKVGATQRLAERVEEPGLDGTYDYYARLRTWQALLEPAEFVVRRFEPEGFVNGSLFQDFFDAVGIAADAASLDQTERRNESLDAESVEFLRLLNLHRQENEARQPAEYDNRSLVNTLVAESSGPILTLPTGALDRFMHRWQETNRAVAREFLDEHRSPLFSAPRRVSGTTPLQHLEPGRVAHFVELLELSDDLRAPLTRIAEREAKEQSG